MKLIESKFLEIEARKNIDFSGKLKINTNITINSIEKIKKQKNMIRIIYTFEINYSELGKILIKGSLILLDDTNIISKILNNNKHKHKSKEYILITNLIMQKASIKALELEEELSLPIHIKLPSISIKE